MSDEEVVVTEEGDVEAPDEQVIEGGTDQGPYTGQSMDIPEQPFNPAAGMTATEVNEQIAQNQQDAGKSAARAAGYPVDDDDDDDDVEVDPDER